VLLGSLTVGCGGALSDEPSNDEHSGWESPAEDAAEDVPSAVDSLPALPTARRVKTLFGPSELPAWMADAPESLVAFRGRLYFAVNRDSGRAGRELWMSDGSEAGTRSVKVFPPEVDTSDTLGALTVAGQRLFFVVGDTSHGRELWTSDGTSTGTRRVRDITPGAGDSHLSGLTAVGSTLLFFRYIEPTPTQPERYELWRSDGTEQGTVRVRAMEPGASLSTSRALAGSTLFFVLSDMAHGTELWKSDGTAAGTVLLKDIHPGPEGSYPYELHVVGRSLFFTADAPSHGRELWKSDGTAAGTVLVEDLEPGPGSGAPRILDALGSHLYFTTLEPSRQALSLHRVRVDGAGGSARVGAIPNPYTEQPDAELSITNVAVAGARLYFGVSISSGPAPVDVQLWVTTGTESGTRMLARPLSLSDEFQSSLFAVEDTLLFSGFEEGTHGLEPWVSDGSASGTRRLLDIAPGAASAYPRSFTRVGNTVFFVAHDETGTNTLWRLPLQHLEQRAELPSASSLAP
jgi:ELWxxDGT repeat protein